MNKPIAKLQEYFLGWLITFPKEIQDKARNLLILCCGGIVVFGIMFVLDIIFLQVFELMATAYAITFCSLALVQLRNARPVNAGNFAICIMFYSFINLALRDAFITDIKQISRINDTAVELIFGMMLATIFVIRRRQFLFVALVSYSSIIAHFLILTYNDFGGVFMTLNITSFLETIMILTVSLLASFRILALTMGQRGTIFTNILFYKFGKGGPTLMYSEKPIQGVEMAAGAYFYTALGQGLQYSTGLFGPLPFGERKSRQVALVHASIVRDSAVSDERLKDRNYFLIALVTFPEDVPIIDRPRLESDLKHVVHEITNLSSLNDDWFAATAKHIRLV